MATDNMTKGEVRMIKLVCQYLINAGYAMNSVHDGEERIKTATVGAALDVVNSVEDSTVYLTRADDQKPAKIALYIVLGNDAEGSEVIADHTDCEIVESAWRNANEIMGF
jgi:hypothetical protein